MISETIVDDEVWAEAPEENDEAFLFIALAARAKLNALNSGELDLGIFTAEQWRNQYVVELSTIANELGIEGLAISVSGNDKAARFAAFDTQLARVLTRIRARKRELLKADSVKLSIVVKSDIQSQLEKIRDLVNRSNLSAKGKERLHRRIDAVEAELKKKRSSMTPFWLLAGAIGTITTGAIHALADLPDALDAVEEIVGKVNKEKAAEDQQEEQLLLSRPQLQLEDKSAAGDDADASSIA